MPCRVGTMMLNKQLQASNTDNMVMLAGLTRARGFRLDDYGVVFDVEFPSMRRSMVWSMQKLERANAGRAVKTAEMAPAIRPREIYQTEIANALVDAILDYTGSIGVGANEWLTIAARESVLDRRFVAGRPERHGDYGHPAHQGKRSAGLARPHARAGRRAQAGRREALLTQTGLDRDR